MSPYVWACVGIVAVMVPVLIAELMTSNDTEHITLILGFMGMALTQLVGMAVSHKTNGIVKQLQERLDQDGTNERTELRDPDEEITGRHRGIDGG